MLDTWHRLERVIKWTGLSVNSFALNIGLKRSENLYQIKKGNNGISRDLATLITTKYPSVSKAWLLTGEGEMFVEQVAASASQAGVPYYGMDILAAVDETVLPRRSFTSAFRYSTTAISPPRTSGRPCCPRSRPERS